MKIPVYEYASKVEHEIEQLSDNDYRSRSTREAKKLIEEKWPLAKLALSFKNPGLKVFVENTVEGSEADGIIYIEGYYDEDMSVQITCDFDYEELLRMEHLNKHGHVPGNGPIKRDKDRKEISAELVAVNVDEFIGNVATKVRKLINKKLGKPYVTKMHLLVVISEVKLRGLTNWNNLIELLEQDIKSTKEKFCSVYLFNEATNELYRAI